MRQSRPPGEPADVSCDEHVRPPTRRCPAADEIQGGPAQRSASLAATWKELPEMTSSPEPAIACCQARVSSTEARPLPSVVMARVGQSIFGRSARMSE